jgi:hypothetical protein
MGLDDNKNLVYLVDYGIASVYLDKDRVHIPFITGK